jgi:hypothetical protein
MAKSNAHAWGQKIGEVLEESILGLLSKFAKKHGLYLDKKGVRPARPGRKASWVDFYGNKHDLDYVFEKGGSPNKTKSTSPLPSLRPRGVDIRSTVVQGAGNSGCHYSAG